jgi:hypothetical protein
VSCLLKAGIEEPEETAFAREWLCKHVSTATTPRDRRNRYASNNRSIVVGRNIPFVNHGKYLDVILDKGVIWILLIEMIEARPSEHLLQSTPY